MSSGYGEPGRIMMTLEVGLFKSGLRVTKLVAITIDGYVSRSACSNTDCAANGFKFNRQGCGFGVSSLEMIQCALPSDLEVTER